MSLENVGSSHIQEGGEHISKQERADQIRNEIEALTPVPKKRGKEKPEKHASIIERRIEELKEELKTLESDTK